MDCCRPGRRRDTRDRDRLSRLSAYQTNSGGVAAVIDRSFDGGYHLHHSRAYALRGDAGSPHDSERPSALGSAFGADRLH